MTEKEKELEQIVKRYYKAMKRYISAVLRNCLDADFLANEVFIRVWKSGINLHDINDIEAYLKKVARSVCVDYYRKNRRDAVGRGKYIPIDEASIFLQEGEE